MENEFCLHKKIIEKQLRSFDFVQNSRKLDPLIIFSSEVVCLHRKCKLVQSLWLIIFQLNRTASNENRLQNLFYPLLVNYVTSFNLQNKKRLPKSTALKREKKTPKRKTLYFTFKSVYLQRFCSVIIICCNKKKAPGLDGKIVLRVCDLIFCSVI